MRLSIRWPLTSWRFSRRRILWFNRANPFAARKEYVGQRVLTLPEAIKAIGGRAGLYVETKHVPFYDALGHDMAGKLVAVLDAHGFPKSRPSNRLYIESFTKASLVRLRAIAPHYTRIQLLPMEDQGRRKDTAKVTAALATEIGAYAHGVGPDKGMLTSAADVAVFHAAGLLVHPYTFRGATTAAKRRPLDNVEANGQSLRQNILADIRRFIDYGIDGGFTDYPDLWMEARRRAKSEERGAESEGPPASFRSSLFALRSSISCWPPARTYRGKPPVDLCRGVLGRSCFYLLVN
jgi:glycerophosphoryl diester phosphodiesterase